MMKKIITSLAELNNLAVKFQPLLNINNIIMLEGNLGAGKTTFIKMLISSVDPNVNVSSPTFNILQQYCLKTLELKINHLDCYRLIKVNDLDYEVMMYLDEFFGSCNIIEWSEILEKYYHLFLDFKITKIEFKIGDEHTRILEISSDDKKFMKSLE